MKPEVVRQEFQIDLRVFWEDTDAGGIVYYANYLKFMERGRSEMVRAVGIDQRRLLADEGILLAVKRCLIEYLSPAKLGDALQVTTLINKIGGASMDLSQTVLCDEVKLVAAEVRLACVGSNGKPKRLPVSIRNKLGTVMKETRETRGA